MASVNTDFPQTKVIIQRTYNKDAEGYDGSKQNVVVVANLPEEVDLGFTAEYDQPFANLSNDLLAKLPIVGSISKTLKVTSPFLSASYWQGSSMNDITLSLVFEAETDPLTEVRQPIINLLSFVTPGYSEGIFIAPVAAPKLSEKQLNAMIEHAGRVVGDAANKSQAFLGEVSSLKDKAQSTNWQDLAKAGASAVLDFMQISQGSQKELAKAFGALTGADAKNSEKMQDSLKKFAESKPLVSENESLVASMNANVDGQHIAPTTDYLMKKLDSYISINIGSYMKFPAVIITNVTTTFSSQIDAFSGWPLSASVQVTFRPMFSQSFGDMYQVLSSEVSSVVTTAKLQQNTDPIDTSLMSSITSGVSGAFKNLADQGLNKVSGEISNVTSKINSGIDDLFK